MSARAESGSGFESTANASGKPADEHAAEIPAWQRAGCLRNPCSPDPDPALFFASPELRQIRDSVLATVCSKPASLSLLIGEAGIGKTTLLREIEMALRQARRRVLFLSGARIEAPLRDIVTPAVLLLDDAGQCEDALLEELERWLADGAQSGAHAVIAVRPEAAARLQSLVDAADRAGLATGSMTLEPFDAVMVGEFLAHRLWRSGFTRPWPLAEATVHRIADRSGGVPAAILGLADAEFEAAWAEEAVFAPSRSEISAPAVLPAVVAVPPAPPRRARHDPAIRTALVATALLAVAGTAGWLAWRTVESARIGVVEVAPPAAPLGNAVAIAPPPAAEASRPATAAPAAPVDSEATTSTVLLAAQVTEPTPMPMAAPQEEPRVVDDARATVEAAVEQVTTEDSVAAPLADAEESAADTAAEPAASESASAEQDETQLAQAPIAPAAGSEAKPEDAVSAAPSPPPASPGPPVIAPSAGVPPALSAAQIASYIRRGDEYVQNGDIAAARLWYERAVAVGDAEAMRALGRTYDPRMLRQWGVVGMPADQARAEEWYRKAAAAERSTPPRQ